ncbi:hypothetical protein GCM10023225_35720 [Kineococcus glutinatus]|uniref:Uncharacterized protein n=1 Tax=Kineococcus glutinatus TaxID=1070872 RepID=A0ABP8VKR5_9ACTN
MERTGSRPAPGAAASALAVLAVVTAFVLALPALVGAGTGYRPRHRHVRPVALRIGPRRFALRTS